MEKSESESSSDSEERRRGRFSCVEAEVDGEVYFFREELRVWRGMLAGLLGWLVEKGILTEAG
jgi:hypothetical protein